MASVAGPPGLYLNRDTYTNRAYEHIWYVFQASLRVVGFSLTPSQL